jgi:hypothetical protein
MDQIELLTTIIGVIVGAGTVAGLVWKIRLPRIDERIREITEDFDKRISELEDKKVRDYERLKRHDENDQAIMSALFAILRHLQTTNETDLMEKVTAKLNEHLIEKL